jgi:hypothetical protein
MDEEDTRSRENAKGPGLTRMELGVMKQQPLLRQHLKADANRMIQIEVPEYFGESVDILIFPSGANPVSMESLARMKLFEETSFARDVLNSQEEECWNDL